MIRVGETVIEGCTFEKAIETIERETDLLTGEVGICLKIHKPDCFYAYGPLQGLLQVPQKLSREGNPHAERTGVCR